MSATIKRKASAVWYNDLTKGHGEVSTESSMLHNAEYSFTKRFEPGSSVQIGAGTNPEELIAAAEAACFSMALAAELGRQGFEPRRISTEATVRLSKQGDVWTISEVALEVEGEVPGLAPERFDEVAGEVKQNCPVSRALNVRITLRVKSRERMAA